ncbi:hypothetical protein ACOSQ3_007885 [Xanthoceras sorbifolium]
MNIGYVNKRFIGMSMVDVQLIINWDEHWICEQEVYWYDGKRSKWMLFPKDATFVQLLDKVYDVTRIVVLFVQHFFFTLLLLLHAGLSSQFFFLLFFFFTFLLSSLQVHGHFFSLLFSTDPLPNLSQ